MPHRVLLFALLLVAPLVASAAPPPAKPDAAGIQFFEKKVRPVLIAHCYECHAGAKGMVKGGLSLDSRAGILEGGEHGPAVLPGKPAESLIIKAIKHEERKMPPKGEKLSDEIVADLTEWIARGAPAPEGKPQPALGKNVDLEAGRKFRSFQPLTKAQPPTVKGAASRIDGFIQAELDKRGLTPSSPASREQLIRRAYFGLIGLPPTPKEIDDFVNDRAPDAWERIVDRLLASEHFGERWARHWLDVARFAESGGYEFDKDRPGAYQYRDFVIRAFNQDMPYDEFVRLQLAGDLLKPNDFNALAATGFLASGPFPGQTTAKTIEIIRYDHLDDMISTTSSAFLGLTLACARCHEHKYDPIPQADYYRLVSAYTKMRIGPVKTKDADGKETTVFGVTSGTGGVALGPQTGATIATATEVYFLMRGEVDRKNGLAKPGYLQVLSDAPVEQWNDGKVDPRVALGNWLTDAKQGAGRLLARVIVNRLWQHHFGEGIIGTPNDFGAQGELPTHPELLDWLAGELIRGGWKLKPIHKLLMTSAAYQRGSDANSKASKVDPENKLLWRYSPQRLEAEVLRDALLAVGGNLDLKLFGPSIAVERADTNRRSIYLQVKRSKLVPMMAMFDAPDAATSLGERPKTTVASQALAMMNSPFVRKQADRLAQRVKPTSDAQLPQAVESAYLIALGRPPTGMESTRAVTFIENLTKSRAAAKTARDSALADFCQVLLCSNEFLYVD